MITGDLKSKVDRLWATFWSNGISNPLSVIERGHRVDRAPLQRDGRGV